MIREIGDVVNGEKSSYKLEKEIMGGANEAFIALDQNNGKKYFLKIYDVPRKASHEDDFDEFLELQSDIAKRLISSPDISGITEKLIEDFLIDNNYYCTVKAIKEGKNLRKLIDEDLENITETEALGLAVVFIGVLKQIHAKEIIHTDLKPAQIFCEPDKTIEFKWRISVSDLDNAHIDGRKWGDDVYTAGYQSPELINREEIIKASDIFTSGIILGEMLTGGYIYDAEEETELEKKILSYSFCQSVLDAVEDMYKDGKQITELIKKMLNPDKSKRPDINEVHDLLIKSFELENSGVKPTIPSTPPSHISVKIPEIIELHCDGEKIIIFENKKEFKRNSFRVFGKDKSSFTSRTLQFIIERDTNGWKISGASNVRSDTLLNDEVINGKEEYLKMNDKIQVGPDLKMVVKW